MGNTLFTPTKKDTRNEHIDLPKAHLKDLKQFIKIEDKYLSTEHIVEALRKSGIESSNLIIGIDYTASNLEKGAITYNGQSLHSINQNYMNPYQSVISIVGKILEPFDEDKLIPSFGFGDIRTKNHKIFNINKNKTPCYTFNEVLQCYNEITPNIKLNGPTSFAPLIRHSIEIVKNTASYHILLIITDGEIIDKKATANLLVEASKYPLSIIAVGVGDGPFNEMEKYDDELPQRKFDNFQFVNYNKIFNESISKNISFEALLALSVLQEIPDQYKYIKRSGLLSFKPSQHMNWENEYIVNDTFQQSMYNIQINKN